MTGNSFGFFFCQKLMEDVSLFLVSLFFQQLSVVADVLEVNELIHRNLPYPLRR